MAASNARERIKLGRIEDSSVKLHYDGTQICD